ncbi:Y-family DNA polymerase [Aureimonas populi]|nr:DNA polymerase Y family protein [Aureimonas populi]
MGAGGGRQGEGRPLVLTEKIEGALRLAALCEEAEALGLSCGLGLAEARARFPGLEACESDPAAEARLLEGVADWCERFTPLVALDGADGLLLDISGCAHLFGGEAAMMEAIVAQVGAQGFAVQAAVAGHAGTARALVRHAPGTRLQEGEEARALAPLPVCALRLAPQAAALLSRLGLRRLGELMALPRAGLTRRFGRALADGLDEALGRRDRPIAPRRPAPLIIHERRLFEPIARQEDVLSIAGTLAERIAGDLEKRGEGARRLELSLFRVDGAVERVGVRLSAPSREPARLARLFKEKLAARGEELDAGFGYDLVKLSVLAADPLAERQVSLEEAQGGGEAVEALLDRLSARLGEVCVFGLEGVGSHRPERAQALRFGAAGDAGAAPFALSPRPLRLLARPEPVIATAEVPEGAPAQFRWRRALHRVARVEGPERIAPEWWREDAGAARDYWRVEDEEGRRYWLFREGHYGGETAPAWYLHGLFA